MFFFWAQHLLKFEKKPVDRRRLDSALYYKTLWRSDFSTPYINGNIRKKNMMKTWTMFLAVLSYDLDRLNIRASGKEIVKIHLIWVPLKRTTELICFFVTHLLKVFYWVWNEPHPWSTTGKNGVRLASCTNLFPSRPENYI